MSKDNAIKLALVLIGLATPWMMRHGIDPKQMLELAPDLVGLAIVLGGVIGRYHSSPTEKKLAAVVRASMPPGPPS